MLQLLRTQAPPSPLELGGDPLVISNDHVPETFRPSKLLSKLSIGWNTPVNGATPEKIFRPASSSSVVPRKLSLDPPTKLKSDTSVPFGAINFAETSRSNSCVMSSEI